MRANASRRGALNSASLILPSLSESRSFSPPGPPTRLISILWPGPPGDELEAVFEPFHRAERSRSRETGGAGLGLTVARQAARAHGGDVTLANRSEGGLVARLQLPLRAGD